jgi:type IV pilus assembly protein PilA
MTSLNSKLQLALINRKKGRNILEKGFTLVELMIVIVIVGVLSSVALPNFLNQTSKAKATECTTKMASLLKQVHADLQLDGDTTQAIRTIQNSATVLAMDTESPQSPDTIARESNSGLFQYKIGFPTGSDADKIREIQISCQAYGTVIPSGTTEYPDSVEDNSLENQGMFGCINLETGKVNVSRRLLESGSAYDVKDTAGESLCKATSNTTTITAPVPVGVLLS